MMPPTIQISAINHWIADIQPSTLSPITEDLIDKLSPNKFRQIRKTKRIMQQIESLVIENIRWTILKETEKTFISFNPKNAVEIGI
jgi:hypothetical protein